MEELYNRLAKKIVEFTKQNKETDISTLARALEMKYGEVQTCIQKMDENGWILVYELDMCCGSEYIVTGLTKEGTRKFLQK